MEKTRIVAAYWLTLGTLWLATYLLWHRRAAAAGPSCVALHWSTPPGASTHFCDLFWRCDFGRRRRTVSSLKRSYKAHCSSSVYLLHLHRAAPAGPRRAKARGLGKKGRETLSLAASNDYNVGNKRDMSGV
jgi:hypothetical protein